MSKKWYRVFRWPILFSKAVPYVLRNRVGVTLPREWSPTSVPTLLDILDGKESVAIVGKGGSYLEVPDAKDQLQKFDYKILLNSFDPDVVSRNLGNDFDAQMTMMCSYFSPINPVATKSMLNNFGIETLIANSTRDKCERYYRMFRKRAKCIACRPTRDEILNRAPWLESVRQEEYNEGRVTIAGSLFHAVAAVPSVRKILLLGVDGFHFDYHYSDSKQLEKSSYYYSMSASGSEDPRISHGKPCFEFIFDTLRCVQNSRELEVWMPRLLQQYIEFPSDVNISWF